MTSSAVGQKSRRSTRYRLSFPTLPSFTAQPGEVDLYQEIGSHDVAIFTFNRPNRRLVDLLQTGTPVLFSFSQENRKTTWTGYVTHVKSQETSQADRDIKIYASGASYVLKAKATRTWTNKSVTDVAKIIAKEFNFTLDTVPSKRRFEQISMTGESYWQWLRTNAEKIGYAFGFIGTHMVLRPLPEILNASTFDAPLLSISPRLTGSNQAAYDRTLDFFELDKSDYHESNDHLFLIKSFSGVNPVSGKVINKSANPSSGNLKTRSNVPLASFTEYSTDVVHSEKFALDAATDSADASGFAFPAIARGQGDGRIFPLKAVNVAGTGGNTDGYWIVDKVQHSFNITGLYEVDMKLITDGVGATSESPFRKASSDRSNKINVGEILLSDIKERSSRGSATQLSRLGRPIFENQQGFARDGSVWRGN